MDRTERRPERGRHGSPARRPGRRDGRRRADARARAPHGDGAPASDGTRARCGGPAPTPSDAASRDDTPPFGRRRHGRFAVGAVAVLVVGALVAALFVLP